MIVPVLIAVAAIKAISIPTFVISVSGSSLAGLSLGALGLKLYQFFTQQPIDPDTAREIAALTLEREQHTTETFRQVEGLVDQSAYDAAYLSHRLQQEQEHITEINQALQRETVDAEESNHALHDVVTLLNHASTLIGDSAHPIISALQCHLENITTTEANFSSIVNLLHVLQHALQETIEKHHSLQEQHESGVAREENPLVILNQKLDTLIHLFSNRKQSTLDPSLTHEVEIRVRQLTQKAQESAALLEQASHRIAELTQINRQLREALRRKNSSSPESEQPNQATLDSLKNRGPGLFSHIS